MRKKKCPLNNEKLSRSLFLSKYNSAGTGRVGTRADSGSSYVITQHTARALSHCGAEEPTQGPTPKREELQH